MSRPLRIEYEGAFYHITARGNERKEIFKDDQDKEAMLDILYKLIISPGH
jgi:putative transposase